MSIPKLIRFNGRANHEPPTVHQAAHRSLKTYTHKCINQSSTVNCSNPLVTSGTPLAFLELSSIGLSEQSSCSQPGNSDKSFAGASRRDFSASPPGLHFHASLRSSAIVPSKSSTTCLPMLGRILNEWLASQRNDRYPIFELTHPLSPVARMKFFHFGCSQISSAASAVSVHQHKALLNSSFSLNRGRKAAIALRIVTSDASGIVSVGCFA